jgi:glutathione S-transferase
MKGWFALHYFDMPGNAEPIRCLFHYAGLDFVDHRFGEPGIEDLREKLPFGQVPALELKDGSLIAQTHAILRFVAKQSPSHLELYPADAAKAALVDSILDQFSDCISGLNVAKYKTRFGFPPSVLNADNAQLVFDVWSKEIFPKHLAFLEHLITTGGSLWLAGTALPTIADFQWGVRLQLNRYWALHENNFPKVAALISGLNSLPAVEQYLKKAYQGYSLAQVNAYIESQKK